MKDFITVEEMLRPYQSTAIANLRKSLKAKVERLMVYSPTGSGKTIMSVGLVKFARLKNKRVGFFVNREHLVEQTSKVFRRYGIQHGILQSTNTCRTYEHVMICSIQTVASRGIPEDLDFIIIDEAHCVPGFKEYKEVIRKFAGKPVIGLSATPFSKGLGQYHAELGGPLFEDMIIASEISDLIGEGYLVDCDIYAPSEPDMTGAKQRPDKFGVMDYSEKDIGEAADKTELIGDIVSHWFKLAKNTPTVVFASNIAHSKHIVEQFRAAGVKAEHIDCYKDSEERRAALARFESGETKIISNAALLAEGWDAPFCETLILARPTKSLIRYIQMVGRVLRPHEGKEKALVLDHSGTVKRLGFPTDDLPLELDDGKPKKSSGQKKEREEPLPKACSSCSYMKPAKVHKCPSCGFEPERQSDVEVLDGELTLMKKSKAPFLVKQSFYSELLGLSAIRGYSDGRVANLYREKFGVWPRGLDRFAVEPSKETIDFVTHCNLRYAKSKGFKRAA